MNAASQERMRDNGANLDNAQELQLLKEALEYLAVVVDSLTRIVDNRFDNRAAEHQAIETSNTAIRELGNQIVHLAEVAQAQDDGIQKVPSQPLAIPSEQAIIDRTPEKQIKKPIVNRDNTHSRKERVARESRLHTHVLLSDEIPHVEPKEGVEPTRIHITSENTVAVNDVDLKLTSDQLFVLNAFLKLRDKDAIKAGDIQRLGFRTTHTQANATALSIAIRQLRENLEATITSDQEEFITQHGSRGSTFYTVNPATITTGVVREKSTVTLDFGDDDECQSFKLPDRFGEYRQDGAAKRLSADLPVTKLLLGKNLGDIIEYQDVDGQPTKVKITAIE